MRFLLILAVTIVLIGAGHLILASPLEPRRKIAATLEDLGDLVSTETDHYRPTQEEIENMAWNMANLKYHGSAYDYILYKYGDRILPLLNPTARDLAQRAIERDRNDREAKQRLQYNTVRRNEFEWRQRRATEEAIRSQNIGSFSEARSSMSSEDGDVARVWPA